MLLFMQCYWVEIKNPPAKVGGKQETLVPSASANAERLLLYKEDCKNVEINQAPDKALIPMADCHALD